MDRFKGWLILCLIANIRCDCNTITCDIEENVNTNSYDENVAESQLSAQIIAFLEHYKQKDPVGIPGAIVPDPLPVPEVAHSLGMGVSLTMKNALAYGVAKFRMRDVSVDVNKMIVKAEIQLDAVEIIGNYTLSSLFSSTDGPFNVTLTNIVASGNASIGVERDGKIRTQNILMDVTFSNLTTNFQNLGVVGNFFQSIINNSPNMVFDTMKPFMLEQAYSKLSTDIDSNIKDLMGEQLLPNSISPLDMAIGEARRRVREMGFDPLILRNYNHTIGLFSIQLKNTWINGVSGFYRVGDIALSLANNTITMELNLGTQVIMGSTEWEVSAGRGIITRTGHIEFSVEFIRATFIMTQTLDTRNRPQIQDLQMEIGNIQIRSDGAATFDYIIEFLINIIPNLLRYQIMDALESPVKARIQNELNQINVERFIRANIIKFEQMCNKSTVSLSDFVL